MKNQNKIIWWTHSSYVDIDTGEQLEKTIATSKQYTIIKKTKKHEIYQQTGTIYIINECRRTGQLQLW